MPAVLLVFLGIVGQVGVAAAPAQAKAKAQVLLSSGTALYEKGDVAGALEKFRAAFALYPSPKLQFNLGQAYRDLGRPLEAREAFNHFVIEAADAPVGMKIEARKALADVESKLGRAQISSSLDGAEVWIDGRGVGTSPIAAPVWLIPGPHKLVARHHDAYDAVDAFQVEAGRLVSVPIGLLPRNRTLSHPEPSPDLTTAAKVAPTPPEPKAALDIRRDSTSDAQYLQTPPTTPSAPPRRPLPGWLPWAGAAATVALATVAIATGISSDNKYNDLKSTCGQTAAGCSSDQTGVVSSRDHAANVFWVLAGTMAVATGVSIFVNTREGGISSLWQF